MLAKRDEGTLRHVNLLLNKNGIAMINPLVIQSDINGFQNIGRLNRTGLAGDPNS